MDERDDLSSGTPVVEAEPSSDQPLSYYQQLVTSWSDSDATCDEESDRFTEAKKRKNIIEFGLEANKRVDSEFSLRPSRLIKVGKQAPLNPTNTKKSYGRQEKHTGREALVVSPPSRVDSAEVQKTTTQPNGRSKKSLPSYPPVMAKWKGNKEARDIEHELRVWKGGWHNEHKLFEMEKKHREVLLNQTPHPQEEDASAKNQYANGFVLQDPTTVEKKDDAAKPYSSWIQGHRKAKEAEVSLSHHDRMGLGRVNLFKRNQKKQKKWSARGRAYRKELNLSTVKPVLTAITGDQESSASGSTAEQSSNNASTTIVENVGEQYEILKSHKQVVKANVEGEGIMASLSLQSLGRQNKAGMERGRPHGSERTLKSQALKLGTIRQQQRKQQVMWKKGDQQQDEIAEPVAKFGNVGGDSKAAKTFVDSKSNEPAKTLRNRVGSTLKAAELKSKDENKALESLSHYHALKQYHSLKLHPKMEELSDPNFHLSHVLDDQHDQSITEGSAASTKVDLDTLIGKLQRVQSGEEVDLESLIDNLQFLKSAEKGDLLATTDGKTVSILRGPDATSPATETNMNRRVCFSDGAASDGAASDGAASDGAASEVSHNEVSRNENTSSYIDDVLGGIVKRLERVDGSTGGYENLSCGNTTGCNDYDTITISTAGMEEEIMDYDSVEGRWVSMGYRKKKEPKGQQYSFFCCGSLLPFFSAKVSVVQE